MKTKIILFIILVTTFSVKAQLTKAGDIAFVGWNADGNDNVAFVTFKDILPDTTVYFCDSEWSATGFGADEGDFAWISGNNTIPAGTIITINNFGGEISSSIGSLVVGNGNQLSDKSDALFAFLGTGSRTVTTMLAGISNSATGYGNLTDSGITLGSTAIVLPEGTDVAIYNGVHIGLDANGYLSQLNNSTNWLIESTDADNDYNNGIAPDLPFGTTSFVISTNDTSAPTVATVSVLTQNTVKITFSENVNSSVTVLTNYTFSPSLTIANATYDSDTNSTTLTHSGFTNGTAYQLTVSNIEDTSNNLLDPNYTSTNLYFNSLTSGLIITEIMYNAPSDNSDQLEFLEIYNNSAETINLGGLKVKDEGNFTFEFQESTLKAGKIVLLATDKTSADDFYGVSFIDMPQGILNALGNGGENLQILNSQNTIISQITYDDASPWSLAADGTGPSLELLNPNGNLNDGNNWTAATNLVGTSLGSKVYASPDVFNPVVTVNVSFDSETLLVNHDNETASITINLSNPSSSVITVNLALSPTIGNLSGGGFTFETQTITFPANTTTQTITIPLMKNTSTDSDIYFSFELTNPTGGNLGGITQKTVYILGDGKDAPVASNTLDINHLSSYLVDATGSAEIVAYDPTSQRLFVMNSTAAKVEILDFSNPSAISPIKSIDLSPYGIGGTSIAAKNSVIAATIEGEDFQNGKVVFMDTNGTILTVIEVGVLPDMVTFTPDGTKVLTANEGQPNDDYTIDPEGSISIINIAGGISSLTQANVTNLNFNTFDGQMENLKSSGVRIFGPNATVSQDLEPEYITVAENGLTAWVTLQENNAIATIDLLKNEITEIHPLGLKDFSNPKNALDTSDQLGSIFMSNWPIKGMYMPDAIANYSVDGTTYIVTANEGDARDYKGLKEEIKASAAILDPTVFPNGDFLKKNSNLGRLAISSKSGDIDNDGDLDELHVFGGRSFSIWNATTGALVYDSANDFEKITAADPIYGVLFNASNDNNNAKNRSDNKGPEPEGITVATIDGKMYAFITLERIGGIMIYDITNPIAPTFVSYKNSRDVASLGGDLGPEGIIYIAPTESPKAKGLIVMANEISATLSVFEISNNALSNQTFTQKDQFTVYPNPIKDGIVYFNRPVTVSLFDSLGRKILEKENASSLNIDAPKGIYLVKTKEGLVQKIIIK